MPLPLIALAPLVGKAAAAGATKAVAAGATKAAVAGATKAAVAGATKAAAGGLAKTTLKNGLLQEAGNLSMGSISPILKARDTWIDRNVDSARVRNLMKYGPLGLLSNNDPQKQRDQADKVNRVMKLESFDANIANQNMQRDQLASTPTMQPITPPTPSLNNGGDINSKIKSILTMKPVPMFRSGGELLLENVIVDGPSHDETNDTGLKDDKGIPVVKDGVKVAEIESKELVLNEGASQELVSLYKEYQKNPSQTLLNKIAALMDYELKYNTYDYTKELLA
jgi:hypothetical protein